MVDFRTSYCKSSLCMQCEKIHAYGMHKLEQFCAHCGLAVCSHGSMGVWATIYESQKSHYPCLKRHENEEKNDIDHALRNDHRIKTTQPISLILVSFFSEDNVLADKIKICYIFEYQSNENRAFRFLGHPV